MNANRLAADTLSAARLRASITEPTIIYHGRRYGETELRALQASDNLESLGDAAPAAQCFLFAIDAARRPTAPEPLHVLTTADETHTPAGIEYAVPAGWTHSHLVIRYVKPRQETVDAR